jgi:hypothetical protein
MGVDLSGCLDDLLGRMPLNQRSVLEMRVESSRSTVITAG